MADTEGPTHVERMTNATLQSAIRLHRAGYLGQAELAYRELLARHPALPDVWHLLGVLSKQCGRTSEAVSMIAQAARLAPGHAVVHFNLGGALRADGRLQEAIVAYDQALQLQPQLLEAWQNLGSIYDEIGDRAAAVTCFQRCVELRPTSTEAATNLARALVKLGRVPEAVEIARRAVALDPQYGPAGNQLGACLRAAGREDEAQAAWRECLRHDPSNVPAWINLGRMLHEQQLLADALACFEQALRLKPDSYEALINLGALQKDLQLYDQAQLTLGRAATLSSARPEAWHNLAKVHEERGELELALRFFEQALSLSPLHPEIRLNRSLLLIQLERFGDGWDEYESRWENQGESLAPPISIPKWTGTSSPGKKLLIYGEQGIGDQIMFASCIPDLLAQGMDVDIVTDVRLAPLFARSFPTAAVHALPANARDWSQLATRANYQVALGSLPRWFRRSADEFPQRDAFLTPDPAQVTKWRQRYAELGQSLKVGISWRAGTTPQNQRHRSPQLEQWQPLMALPDAQFICLQYGATATEIAQFRKLGASVRWWSETDPLVDLDDFAAQVNALDLVISVGNATVHMAGAVGTRCWALLPRTWGWRWGTQRRASLWYRSVRLWRQGTAGDWDGLFAQVTRELAAETNDCANGADGTAGRSA